MTDASPYRRVLATVGFFTLAAGDFWRFLAGYPGWIAIVGVLFVLTVIELIRMRIDLRRLPITLGLFLALTVVSIAWSAYREWTVLGAVATLVTATFAVFVATALDIPTLLRCLGSALRWALGLSLLFGAAVALGAQDLFKNLIAGVFIIAERRFQNGDWIKAEGVVEGTVETIGLRTTKVRQFDLAPVYVPNAKLADNAVINYAQMTHYRISWVIGLEYGATVDQLRRVRDGIEAHVRGSADFVLPPDAPVAVRVDKFNDSSIDLMVYCFANTTNWGDWLKIKESMIYAFKNIVEAAGCGFAFPSRSLYVETMPAGMDVLTPHPPEIAAGRRAAAIPVHPISTPQPPSSRSQAAARGRQDRIRCLADRQRCAQWPATT